MSLDMANTNNASQNNNKDKVKNPRPKGDHCFIESQINIL